MEQVYPGGQLVSEGEIAEATVSRTPVREALLRLETEGLVKLYPKRGALIRPVSAREIADVIEARRLVELHAADRVWPRRARCAPTWPAGWTRCAARTLPVTSPP
ncbi:GntR family transcriptional regulator [Micromonospora sp. BRA006-A]|nr:GntR family transcriptional regulator [Micromonospora sp. BRA006-A]